jgi:hypothetical protein
MRYAARLISESGQSRGFTPVVGAAKLDFVKAFPDEGDIDMAHALVAYRDVGYPTMLMPDHVPQIDGRDSSGVAFLLLRLYPGPARCARAVVGVPDRFAAAGCSGHPQGSTARAV